MVRLRSICLDKWLVFITRKSQQTESNKQAYHTLIEGLSFLWNDNENACHDAFKGETLVKQGMYN